MDAASENIKTIIINETDWVPGTDLFVGSEPAKPHNTLTLFDTPDAGPMSFGNNSGARYDYDGVQARIRHKRYDVAIKQARALVKVLHDRGNELVNDTFVTKIEALDNPSLLDYDDNDRARVVVNFKVQQTRKPST